jgi:glutathione S-transferase
MLKVHHLGVSQSERIVWLCEELAIPYELVRYDRDPVTRLAPPEYKALHPAGTAPVIEHDGVVLSETGAIVDYLLARFPDRGLVVKSDEPEFANYLFWLHFANGSFMPRGMFQMIASAMGAEGGAGMLGERSTQAYQMAEARLGEAPFFGGERFTAADIMMVFPLTRMRLFAQRDLGPYPNIRAYLTRIGERPAYQAAMAKGDPELTLQLS